MKPPKVTRKELDDYMKKNKVRFARAMGITCQKLGYGEAVVRMKANPRWMHSRNVTFGGGLMTLADVALYYAIIGQLGLKPALTQDLKINFIRPASGGNVMAHARVLAAGRRSVFGEIKLHIARRPRIVAHAMASYVLRQPKGAARRRKKPHRRTLKRKK